VKDFRANFRCRVLISTQHKCWTAYLIAEETVPEQHFYVGSFLVLIRVFRVQIYDKNVTQQLQFRLLTISSGLNMPNCTLFTVLSGALLSLAAILVANTSLLRSSPCKCVVARYGVAWKIHPHSRWWESCTCAQMYAVAYHTKIGLYLFNAKWFNPLKIIYTE
jgi:hypothetical protein